LIPEAEMLQRWHVEREKLLRLDPASGFVDFSDAFELSKARDWEAAAELYLRGLEKDLTDSLNIRSASMFAKTIGKLDVAQRLAELATAIDPYCFQCLRVLSEILMYRGDYDKALDVRSRYLAVASGGLAYYSMMLILAGQPEKVAAVWSQVQGGPGFQGQASLAMADHAMGKTESASAREAWLETDLARAREADASQEQIIYQQYDLAMVNAWLGNKDKAFAYLMPLVDVDYTGNVNFDLYHPAWRGIREDPRWAEFREAIGMSEERFAAIEFDPWLPE